LPEKKENDHCPLLLYSFKGSPRNERGKKRHYTTGKGKGRGKTPTPWCRKQDRSRTPATVLPTAKRITKKKNRNGPPACVRERRRERKHTLATQPKKERQPEIHFTESGKNQRKKKKHSTDIRSCCTSRRKRKKKNSNDTIRKKKGPPYPLWEEKPQPLRQVQKGGNETI